MNINELLNTSYYLVRKQDIQRLGNLVINNKLIKEIPEELTYNETINYINQALITATGNKDNPYTTFIDGTESNFVQDTKVTNINDYAFYGFSDLGTKNDGLDVLNFPNARRIGSHAFEKCGLYNIANQQCTEIGSYAFSDCANLSTVQFTSSVLPSSLGTIHEQAFANLSSLTLFSSPNFSSIGSSAFKDCGGLTELYAINAHPADTALVGCTALEHLSLGYVQSLNKNNKYDGLNTVGGLRFTAAPNLKTINLPYVVSLTGNATSTSKTIAFLKMTSLQKATFSKLQNIGQYAFHGCTALSTLTGIDNVTTIQSQAFYNCNALTTCGNTSNLVEFSKITKVTNQAFAYCNAITQASFPAATTIEAKAFIGCTNLNSLYAPQVNTLDGTATSTLSNLSYVTLGINSLQKNQLTSATATLTTLNLPLATKVVSTFKIAGKAYSALTSISLPKVTTIEANAFEGCYNLQSLNLPRRSYVKTAKINNVYYYSNAATISASAFRNCTNLSTVTLSAQNLTIGANTFENCAATIENNPIGLATFTAAGAPNPSATEETPLYISNTMTFGQNAFLHCYKLSSVTIGHPEATATITIGANAFQGCYSITQDNLRIAASGSITINGNAFANEVDAQGQVTYDNPQITEINNTIFNCSKLINIAPNAFADCSTIKNVNLNNEVTYIQNMAFAGCSFSNISIKGTTCILPSNRKIGTVTSYHSPFEEITELQTLTFENLKGLTTAVASQNAVPTNAFINATATTLNITGSTLTPANNAFSNSSFQTININYLTQTNNNTPFANTTALTALSIGLDSNFKSAKLLTNAGGTITDNYKGYDLTITGRQYNTETASYSDTPMSINVANAFAGTHAKTMTFPNLTSIGNVAQVFYNNTTMTTFNAPLLQSITGKQVFQNCTALTNINLPALTSIPQNAFANCSALTSLNLPKVSSIYAASASVKGYAIFESCTNLTTLTLGEEGGTPIPTIGQQLYSLTALTDATIYATTITDTFTKASSTLTNVNLPVTTTVNGAAFTDCITLKTLQLPQVTTISGTAFNNTSFITKSTIEMSKLQTINIKAYNTTTHKLTNTPFQNCHNFNIKLSAVPIFANYNANNKFTTNIDADTDSLAAIFADSDFLASAVNKCYIMLPNSIYNNLASLWKITLNIFKY